MGMDSYGFYWICGILEGAFFSGVFMLHMWVSADCLDRKCGDDLRNPVLGEIQPNSCPVGERLLNHQAIVEISILVMTGTVSMVDTPNFLTGPPRR